LLTLAEGSTAENLKRQMRGEKSLGDAHCVLMYFTPKQYPELEEALLHHGGVKSGRGILNKEEALLRIVRAVKE
jgi:hypothetical protein